MGQMQLQKEVRMLIEEGNQGFEMGSTRDLRMPSILHTLELNKFDELLKLPVLDVVFHLLGPSIRSRYVSR